MTLSNDLDALWTILNLIQEFIIVCVFRIYMLQSGCGRRTRTATKRATHRSHKGNTRKEINYLSCVRWQCDVYASQVLFICKTQSNLTPCSYFIWCTFKAIEYICIVRGSVYLSPQHLLNCAHWCKSNKLYIVDAPNRAFARTHTPSHTHMRAHSQSLSMCSLLTSYRC